MCMLMVFVMRMRVVVLQSFVSVEMAVPLPKKQHHSGDHQRCRNYIG